MFCLGVRSCDMLPIVNGGGENFTSVVGRVITTAQVFDAFAFKTQRGAKIFARFQAPQIGGSFALQLYPSACGVKTQVFKVGTTTIVPIFHVNREACIGLELRRIA